jgi:CRP/FNR family transcriptional regulator
MIGTARESVNRMLSEYKSAGVLSFDQGVLTIHKLQDLKDVVSCPDCPAEICRI